MKFNPIFLLTGICVFLFVSVNAQQSISYERERHRRMLNLIKDDIKKNYFDPKFKGIDLEANFKAADEKLKKADSIGQLSGIIAQFMLDFEDSHLFFIPPEKVNKIDYGFDIRMIGDKCLIVRIDEKSDAAQKGLKVGDEIYDLESFAPARTNLWKMRYYYNRLRPRQTLRLTVIKPDGKSFEVEILAKITPGKPLRGTGDDINAIIREDEDAYLKSVKQFYYEKIDGLFIWKMPGFSLEPAKVDDIMGKAQKGEAMILDLRGNGGGRVDMVLRLISNFFPENVKVCDEKRRKETKEIIAKSRGKDAYTGKLVVLIDSDSGSASEVFSRVIQLEKRGIIIGDQSAGAVMESMYFGHQIGVDIVTFFGASITIADLIMKDGKSLENTGVIPDISLIPTPKNLADGRDIVLSKAAETLGFNLTPEEAGKIFPNEYEK